MQDAPRGGVEDGLLVAVRRLPVGVRGRPLVGARWHARQRRPVGIVRERTPRAFVARRVVEAPRAGCSCARSDAGGVGGGEPIGGGGNPRLLGRERLALLAAGGEERVLAHVRACPERLRRHQRGIADGSVAHAKDMAVVVRVDVSMAVPTTGLGLADVVGVLVIVAVRVGMAGAVQVQMRAVVLMEVGLVGWRAGVDVGVRLVGIAVRRMLLRVHLWRSGRARRGCFGRALHIAGRAKCGQPRGARRHRRWLGHALRVMGSRLMVFLAAHVLTG